MQMMKRLLSLLICLLLLCPAAVAEDAAPILEVHQMCLGYADGYYLCCGDIEIMIDGGNPIPRSVNDDVINYLRAVGADKLDAHIVTHWHLDHCQNLNTVLAEFGDANTIVYGASEVLPETADGEGVVIQISPLANGTYRHMKVDDVIRIGDLTITCIGPETISQRGKCNADSLNFVLQYGERRMLFTGDYAQSGEINKRYPELCSNVDVLKFPHHGSLPYEIGQKAVQMVSPTYVLIPSRESGYQLWKFLRDRGVDIERDNVLNNSAGHVVLLTDGGEYFEARRDQNPADYAPMAK